MINPGWVCPGKAHVGLQQAAACRILQNKLSHGEALKSVFWMNAQKEGGA